MAGLDTPLTPLRFLERAAEVHPDAEAVVDGDRRITNSELADAAQRLASAIRASGVGAGERVAFLATNRLELLVAHFGVPLAGTVIGDNAGESVRTPYDDCVLVMPSTRQARAGVTVVRFARRELLG